MDELEETVGRDFGSWLDAGHHRVREDMKALTDARRRRDYDAALAYARRTKTKKPPPPEYGTPLDDCSPWDVVLLNERQLLRRTLVRATRDVADVRRWPASSSPARTAAAWGPSSATCAR